MEPIFVNKQLFTLTAPLGSRLLPHGLFARFSAAAGIVLAVGSMEMGPGPARRSTCCIRITVTCSRSADSSSWRPRCLSLRSTCFFEKNCFRLIFPLARPEIYDIIILYIIVDCFQVDREQ